MSLDYDGEARRKHEARRLLACSVEPKSLFLPIHAPDLLPAMRHYLESRELSTDLALTHGWYPAWCNGPRVIIPCIRTDGYTFWQGRRIDTVPFADGCKRWDSPGGPRGDALCYLPTKYACTNNEEFVLVEGPADALAAAGCGYSAIALLGVDPPGGVLAHAASIIQDRRAICLTDRDSIGKWIKIQHRLGLMGLHTKLVEPTEKDLAKMPKQQRKILLETSFSS